MNTIYVVMSGRGEYSDRSEEVVAAFDLEVMAEAFVSSMEKLNLFNVEFYNLLTKECPTPQSSSEPKGIQRGYSEDWHAYHLRVKPLQEEASRIRNELYEKWHAARAAWIALNYQVPDNLKTIAHLQPFDADQYASEQNFWIVETDFYVAPNEF